MSQEVVKQIIQRAVSDEAFRTLLFDDVAQATEEYDLTPEELGALG